MNQVTRRGGGVFGWFAVAMLVSCQAPSPARYLMTAIPAQIPGTSIPFCVAIDPADPKGVWWWSPVDTDCGRRSTGPGVFRADGAFVSREDTNVLRAGMRVQLIPMPGSDGPQFVDVRFLLRDEVLHLVGTGERVPMRRRADLEIPES